MYAMVAPNVAESSESPVARAARLDAKRLRTKSGMSLEAVTRMLGHQRAMLSKVETGQISIKLDDYLAIVDLFADQHPNHPGLALSRYLKTAKLD